MMRSHLIVPLLLSSVLLGACAGGNDAAREPTETVTVTETVPIEDPTEAQKPTPAAPLDDSQFDPNVGDRALRVGQPRVGKDVTTVVLRAQWDYPADPGRYREPQPGNEFFGVKLSQCVRKDAESSPEDLYSAGAGDFYLATPDGTQTPGGSTFTDWPTPKFPEYVTMNPGDCLKGWIALEVPASNTKPEKVVWRPAGQTLAEWVL